VTTWVLERLDDLGKANNTVGWDLKLPLHWRLRFGLWSLLLWLWSLLELVGPHLEVDLLLLLLFNFLFDLFLPVETSLSFTSCLLEHHGNWVA